MWLGRTPCEEIRYKGPRHDVAKGHMKFLEEGCEPLFSRALSPISHSISASLPCKESLCLTYKTAGKPRALQLLYKGREQYQFVKMP